MSDHANLQIILAFFVGLFADALNDHSQQHSTLQGSEECVLSLFATLSWKLAGFKRMLQTTHTPYKHMCTCRDNALTFMNSFMVVGGYFLPGPWISTLSLGHTNQPIE